MIPPRDFGGRIEGGILEMRDPNDNARHRYQYAMIDGVPSRRVLPARGDYDPPAQWEPIESFSPGLSPGNPIAAYLAGIGRKGGKAGTGASQRRGDAAYYRELAAKSAAARRAKRLTSAKDGGK